MIKIFVFFCVLVQINSVSCADSTKTISGVHKFGLINKPDKIASFHSQLKKTTVWQDLGNDLKYFATDWGAYLTLPLHMKGSDFVYAGAVIGGTVIISTTDKVVRDKVSRHGYGTYNHDFWDIPTAYGFVQYPSIFGAGLYAVGLFTREAEIRKTGRMLIQALVYSGTITMGLRYVFGRHRPFTSETGSQYEFSWFNTSGDTQSFPSGHMVVAMATSTVLAEKINTWWARAILYPFAFLTGYARIYNDQHWLSDVVFAAALGYGTGRFVLNQEERREKDAKKKVKNKGSGLNFYPTMTGLGIVWRF
jgi:membrane-associated phospholipid phosphatase